MSFPAGEGFDCSFGISGSFSGFANIISKGGKHKLTSKKKLLTDGVGNTKGYKYYDPSEELSLEFWVQGGDGETGTLQATYPATGTKVVVTSAIQNHITGSWSLDSLEFSAVAEDVESGTMTLSRYSNTTIA